MDLGIFRLVINQRKKFTLDFYAIEHAVYFVELVQQIGQLWMIAQLTQEFPRKAAASGFERLQPFGLVRHRVSTL
jgi:hypothetical protein